MLGRNIDFFAVALIALGLMTFSKLPQVGLHRSADIRFERAAATDQCPLMTFFGR